VKTVAKDLLTFPIVQKTHSYITYARGITHSTYKLRANNSNHRLHSKTYGILL